MRRKDTVHAHGHTKHMHLQTHSPAVCLAAHQSTGMAAAKREGKVRPCIAALHFHGLSILGGGSHRGSVAALANIPAPAGEPQQGSSLGWNREAPGGQRLHGCAGILHMARRSSGRACSMHGMRGGGNSPPAPDLQPLGPPTCKVPPAAQLQELVAAQHCHWGGRWRELAVSHLSLGNP